MFQVDGLIVANIIIRTMPKPLTTEAGIILQFKSVNES